MDNISTANAAPFFDVDYFLKNMSTILNSSNMTKEKADRIAEALHSAANRASERSKDLEAKMISEAKVKMEKQKWIDGAIDKIDEYWTDQARDANFEDIGKFATVVMAQMPGNEDWTIGDLEICFKSMTDTAGMLFKLSKGHKSYEEKIKDVIDSFNKERNSIADSLKKFNDFNSSDWLKSWIRNTNW